CGVAKRAVVQRGSSAGRGPRRGVCVAQWEILDASLLSGCREGPLLPVPDRPRRLRLQRRQSTGRQCTLQDHRRLPVRVPMSPGHDGRLGSVLLRTRPSAVLRARVARAGERSTVQVRPSTALSRWTGLHRKAALLTSQAVAALVASGLIAETLVRAGSV